MQVAGSVRLLRVDRRKPPEIIHVLLGAATTTGGGSSKVTVARWRSNKTDPASSRFNAPTPGSAIPTPSPSSGGAGGKEPLPTERVGQAGSPSGQEKNPRFCFFRMYLPFCHRCPECDASTVVFCPLQSTRPRGLGVRMERVRLDPTGKVGSLKVKDGEGDACLFQKFDAA